jgi:hypothetical protein
MKVGLCEHLAVCVYVYPPPHQLLNGWTNLYEIWYVCNGTWAHLSGYFINPSHQSVCLYVYPLNVARQLLGKDIAAANEYTRNNRVIVGRVVSYGACVIRVSKESRRLVLPRTCSNRCEICYILASWLIMYAKLSTGTVACLDYLN